MAATRPVRQSCSIPILSRHRIPTTSRCSLPGATIQAAEHAIREREPAFALGTPARASRRVRSSDGLLLVQQRRRCGSSDACERPRADGDRRHRCAPRQRDASDLLWRFRACSTCRLTSFRSTQGPAPRTKLGRARGAALPSICRWTPGSTDADYALVHRDIIGPVLDAFRPELVLVSAGYDAHERDPLASMRMTVDGYAAVVGSLRDVAIEHGALALVTEGGYDLTALAACLEASIAVLDGELGARHRGARSDSRRAGCGGGSCGAEALLAIHLMCLTYDSCRLRQAQSRFEMTCLSTEGLMDDVRRASR